MRTRRFMATAVTAALVLVMSGCGDSAPEVTDEQVATWEKLAASTIPAATDVSIRADHHVNMVGGGSNVVSIDVEFANFADLRASETAIIDLRTTIDDEAPGTSVDVSAVVADSDAHGTAIGDRLVRNVPGVANAVVSESAYYLYASQASGLRMSGSLALYVDDSSLLNPAWLDHVADVARDGFAEVDGDLFGISIFPADALDRVASDPQYKPVPIHVDQLQAFTDHGVSDGCVRTESWAYYVTGDKIIAQRVGDPGGLCS